MASVLELPLILLMIFLLVLDMTPSANSKHDIVPETCKICGKNYREFNYTFCVESLESVPKSRDSDRPGLAIIAVKLTKPEVKRALSKVKHLLKKAQPPLSPYFKSCLETCREMYSDCIIQLEAAVKTIKAGQYVDANVKLTAAIVAPVTCEDSFKEGGIESPLAAEDGHLYSRILIPIAITDILSPFIEK